MCIVRIHFVHCRNFYKHAGPKLQETCDINCKKQYLCRIIVHSETELCNNILKN